MFTGIVERSVPITAAASRGDGLRLSIADAWHDVKLGESIAINGVCLTVAEMAAGTLYFDAVRETLDKTNLGLLKPGDEVHVERSLRVGDRIDGHTVQGHVDGTAELLSHRQTDLDWRMTIRTPPALAKYLIPKGSITLDGTSLTIAAIAADNFEVALIPTTLEITRLGKRPIGWPLNMECDMMVKTIVATIERMEQTRTQLMTVKTIVATIERMAETRMQFR
jgi:riboflavin synthase